MKKSILGIVMMLGLLSFGQAAVLDEAVTWMNENGLTKFDNSIDFMAMKGLRRDEASKFFVQYAKEVLHLTPDTNKTSCNFTDLNQARPDLKDLIKEACQLGLFQGYSGKFMPTQSLTNAQAITVLIRMIDGKKDETQGHFAQKYFEKAQELGIMNGLDLSSTNNFDNVTTRGDVGMLLFNSSKLSSHINQNKQYYIVTRIIDGDTIETSSGGIVEKIRLIGIDTPETVDTGKPIQCFGQEASKRTTELLLNKKVLLINDKTQNDKDIYDRLLRYVYTEDGTLINEQLIKDGYAMEYTYKTAYIYQDQFKTAEQEARSNKVGLWADNTCGNTNTTIDSTKSITNIITHNIFYTSSHYSSNLYYCDTDSTREELSSKYLTSFSTESELLKRYPGKTLHEACK